MSISFLLILHQWILFPVYVKSYVSRISKWLTVSNLYEYQSRPMEVLLLYSGTFHCQSLAKWKRIVQNSFFELRWSLCYYLNTNDTDAGNKLQLCVKSRISDAIADINFALQLQLSFEGQSHQQSIAWFEVLAKKVVDSRTTLSYSFTDWHSVEDSTKKNLGKLSQTKTFCVFRLIRWKSGTTHPQVSVLLQSRRVWLF